MTDEEVRERQVNLRLSVEEAERLAFVAQHHGLNGPNVLRLLLKREEAAIRAAQTSEAAKKRSPRK